MGSCCMLFIVRFRSSLALEICKESSSRDHHIWAFQEFMCHGQTLDCIILYAHMIILGDGHQSRQGNFICPLCEDSHEIGWMSKNHQSCI